MFFIFCSSNLLRLIPYAKPLGKDLLLNERDAKVFVCVLYLYVFFVIYDNLYGLIFSLSFCVKEYSIVFA
jgi:hypothetical protein